MRVCMVAKAHLKEAQKSVDIRLVVVPESLFLLYCFALIVQILLSDAQRPHAIAFQPQSQRQLAGWQRLKIISAFARGGPVHGAAGVRYVLEMRGFGYIFGTLE